MDDGDSYRMMLDHEQEDADTGSAASDLLAIVALLLLVAVVRVLEWFDADAGTESARRVTVERTQEVHE